MTLADSAGVALGVTAVCAVLALVARALTFGGAIAGAAVGACVSIGFGLPGLAVLGTFFVVGTLATRVGWETKKARGTAEAGEGRRDWKRVLGKGGVAAWIALAMANSHAGLNLWPAWICPTAFAGALAAALADTLGTEFGVLWTRNALLLPVLRRVTSGTAGAVSPLGTIAGVLGAALIAFVAQQAGLYSYPGIEVGVALAGIVASLAESIAVGLGLRAPGFVRNILTTVVGAVLAAQHWNSFHLK